MVVDADWKPPRTKNGLPTNPVRHTHTARGR